MFNKDRIPLHSQTLLYCKCHKNASDIRNIWISSLDQAEYVITNQVCSPMVHSRMGKLQGDSHAQILHSRVPAVDWSSSRTLDEISSAQMISTTSGV